MNEEDRFLHFCDEESSALQNCIDKGLIKKGYLASNNIKVVAKSQEPESTIQTLILGVVLLDADPFSKTLTYPKNVDILGNITYQTIPMSDEASEEAKAFLHLLQHPLH